MRKARHVLYLLILISCIFGCAPQTEEDPHALLDQALGVFESKHSVVELEKSGSIIPQSVIQAGNPLSDVDQFKSRIRGVAIDDKLSSTDHTVLAVTMNAESSKQALADKLRSQLEEIRKETKLSSQAVNRNARMEEEINARLAAAEDELNQLLNAVQVDSVVRLWIDRRTKMPARMKVDTQLIKQGAQAVPMKEQLTESFRIT